MNHMRFCICISTSSINCGEIFTKRLWYAAPVSLAGKMYGPISQSPTVPTPTLIESQW